jgi:transposase
MLRELNVVEQRYRAVVEVLSGTPVIEVAERYGVARQTVHRWMARYRTEGLDGLTDRSHAPRQHPWRIQVGLPHAGKTAEITVQADTYQITVEDGIALTAPRTTGRDIKRHKASRYPGRGGPDG